MKTTNKNLKNSIPHSFCYEKTQETVNDIVFPRFEKFFFLFIDFRKSVIVEGCVSDCSAGRAAKAQH